MTVKNNMELRQIIFEKKIPLQTLDVSNITNFSDLFRDITKINGWIDNWETSQVTNMSYMFYNSTISPDISKWNVSKVEDMDFMFSGSKFNDDISNWDVSKVKRMDYMFSRSKFNGDISRWNTESLEIIKSIFELAKFDGDISSWNTSNIIDMSYIFNKNSNAINISHWHISDIDEGRIFLGSKYTYEEYKKDRKEYLTKINEKILKEAEEKYNKNINLTTLEMEF